MASFGEELRRERELRDISLKEISEATNIPIRFLEALEQNNFALLPGGAYNRGFIRSYARHVGINVDEMVDRYHEEVRRREARTQASAGRPAPAERGPGEGKTVVGVAAAAVSLSAVVIALVYWVGTGERAAPASGSTASHAVALKARVKKSGAVQPPAITDPPRSLEPQPVEAEEPALPGAEHLVRVRALETTWVRLTCADEVAFDGDLWVGSERHFPCRDPISISAGNGGAVECSVDSSALQLLGDRGEMVRGRTLPLPPPGPPT